MLVLSRAARRASRSSRCSPITLSNAFTVTGGQIQRSRGTYPCPPAQVSSKNYATTTSGVSDSLEHKFRLLATDNPILLRDQCLCSQCVDTSTLQRDFLFTDIPSTISASEVNSKPDGSYTISWQNDVPSSHPHTSIFTAEQVSHILSRYPRTPESNRTLSLWNRSTFDSETKEIDYQAVLSDDDTLSQALKLLEKHGLFFITGIPYDDTAVRHLVNRLALLKNTFYGETWDVRSVPKAKNVAYTSKTLGFHMDLLYMKESPGLQLLHCLENSCTGGESEFADCFKAIDTLMREYPEYAERLTKSVITYGYENDGQFFMNDKPVIKLRLLSEEATGLTIYGAHNQSWMSRVERVYWSPPFMKSIAKAAHDGNTPAFLDASRKFAEILERPKMKYEAKLPAGTCAVFDNLRVVHARRAFDMNSGKRWLKGVYGDHQDVWSKTQRYLGSGNRA